MTNGILQGCSEPDFMNTTANTMYIDSNYNTNMNTAAKPALDNDKLKSMMNDIMHMCDLYEVNPSFRADLLKALIEAYKTDNAVSSNPYGLIYTNSNGSASLGHGVVTSTAQWEASANSNLSAQTKAETAALSDRIPYIANVRREGLRYKASS